MKKILILTSERTGTGHKSAANALEKQLKELNYDVKQIDCFTTMKKTGKLLEDSYIPITTKFPLVFYLAFLFSQIFPDIISFFMYLKSRKKLKKEFLDYKPDLIISNHPMFTKAVSILLKKEKLNIPFFIDVIDLVNPPKKSGTHHPKKRRRSPAPTPAFLFFLIVCTAYILLFLCNGLQINYSGIMSRSSGR